MSQSARHPPSRLDSVKDSDVTSDIVDAIARERIRRETIYILLQSVQPAGRRSLNSLPVPNLPNAAVYRDAETHYPIDENDLSHIPY